MNLGNKSVLITGADGFIGSHLVELLVQRAGRVKALACYNAFNNWGWLETLECRSDIEVHTGDIRDSHFCRRIMSGVDVVFHLAALIGIPYSYLAPDSYVDTNIKGTLNICQAALDKGCERIVHTSTSEVYGTAIRVPIDENHPLQPQSPYSASKIGADAMAMSFHLSFGLPVVTARPFNTYGPRQSARAVIPTIITQIAAGREVIEVGDLRPTRDFNYVLDTCAGFLALAEGDSCVGEVINIATGTEVAIAEVLDQIRQIMRRPVDFRVDEARMRPAKSEVLRLCGDNEKIRRLTGFRPKYTLRQGLERTVEWFADPANRIGYKADLYNV
ncbi:NAD-dependent 4,6-dehydratase LegB [Petrachloros mirabilis]